MSELIKAASSGDVTKLEELLSAGEDDDNFDINVQDNHQRTALHMAVHFHHTEAVKKLIEAGANVHVCAKDNATPLIFACMRGWEDIVSLLLQSGAKVSNSLTNKRTCLHLAAMKGHTEVVRRLVRWNADINAKTKKGETPMDMAANDAVKAAITETVPKSKKRAQAAVVVPSMAGDDGDNEGEGEDASAKKHKTDECAIGPACRPVPTTAEEASQEGSSTAASEPPAAQPASTDTTTVSERPEVTANGGSA